MGPNRGGRWLDVGAARTGGYILQESACLQRLIEGMANPANQYPQLWVFLGSASKNRCLHAIFAQNNFTRAPLGALRLRADLATISDHSPVFFVDGDPCSISTTPDASPARGGYRHCLDWNVDAVDEVIHRLYSQVIFPFANTVCMFVDDFPIGFNPADLIVHCDVIAGLPRSVRPRLVIVVGAAQGTAAWSSLIQSNQFSEAFSAVSIFISTDADRGHDRLKGLLEAHAQEVRNLRQAFFGQLSGVQWKIFLRSAIARFATTRNYSFDPIRSSRLLHDMPQDIGDNLRDFHRVCTKVGIAERDAARFVASALLMDHYRPDMPLMSPTLVFQTLYRPLILKFGPSPLRLELIETELVIEFNGLREQGVTSLELRKRFVGHGHYSLIKSNRLCLYCLVRTAQHFPPCDHPLCDLCAQRFGTPAVDLEYRFSVDQCLLCNATATMVIDVLPPTMDPSILAIDGGGVRGVIPIEFLILIDEYVGECRLQSLFDLDISTSSGGLIDLGFRVLNLPATVCAELFDQLARQIFHNRRPAAFPWLPQYLLGHMRQWYSWWRLDSCYDGTVFDAVLRHLYGDQLLLYSCARRDYFESMAKYAVVANSIGDKNEPVIIGNFNATDQTLDDCEGYRLIRPLDIGDELSVWQAARATAAAPFIFAPIDTRVGSFQDGGLTDNFAGGIARRVSRAIWPSSREPARLLSLGTGIPPQAASDHLPHFRHSILDGFLRRAFSAWMTSLDGEIKWREMKSQMDDSIVGNFRRLNVPLDGLSSALDDVTMIDDYRNLVLRYPGSARMAKDAAIDLMTARFFF